MDWNEQIGVAYFSKNTPSLQFNLKPCIRWKKRQCIFCMIWATVTSHSCTYLGEKRLASRLSPRKSCTYAGHSFGYWSTFHIKTQYHQKELIIYLWLRHKHIRQCNTTQSSYLFIYLWNKTRRTKHANLNLLVWDQVFTHGLFFSLNDLFLLV